MLRKRSLISKKYREVSFLTKEEKENIKRDFPWTHYVLDNFIEEKAFKRMQKTLLSKKHKFSIADEDPYSVQFALLRYLPLAKVFYSLEFKTLLETFTKTSLSLKTSNYVQLRYMNLDSPALPVHIDTDVGKAIIAIYYLSPDWVEGLGGELCLYESKVGSEKKVIINPIENRLVLFLSDQSSWHSVEKVQNWERYSVLSTWNIKSFK